MIDIRKMIEDRLTYYEHLLPEHMREGVRLYVLDNIEPSSFMRAVLENDLRESVARADHINKERLSDIVTFCFEALPAGSWGSVEKVKRWLDARGDGY